VSLPATDDFNRADSGSLGANWTETDHGLQIVSNEARVITNGAYQFAYWNADAFDSDHYSQAVFAGSPADMEVCTRVQAGGNLYMLMVNSGSTVTRIYKRLSGSFTQIGSDGAAPTVGHTYKFEANGSALTGYDNGVAISGPGSGGDASITGGSAGLGGSSSGVGWDDWQGGDVNPPAPSGGAIVFNAMIG
jgi:hypothetical protein